MDTQALKDKILQLAIQGKLVPQNENDEPASVLLERIKEEKEQLVKDKVIKKEKPLHDINDDEKIFKLPKGWELARLNDVCIDFLVPQRDKPKKFNGDIPWCRIEDIEGKFLNGTKSNQYVSQEIVDKMNLKINPVGTVICSCSASLGIQAIVTRPCCTNQTFIGLVPASKLNNVYLYYFLMSQRKYFYEIGAGTTIPYISKKKFQELIIPLPPLEEQKRIVAKVDSLFKLIDELDSNKQDLLQNISDARNKVLQLAIEGKLVPQNEKDEPASVLLEKIKEEKEQLVKDKIIKKEKPLPEITNEEKLFDIPKDWEWVKMGEIGIWRAGSTPSRANTCYYNGNIPWIKTGELNDGYIYDSEEKITETALSESSLKLNPIGSVLIAMYGATIGKVGILQVEAATNQACCSCITYVGVYNRYLFFVLLSMRKYFKRQSFGGAQPNISKQKIINTAMPLPPLEEQKRIVEKIEKIMSYLDKIEENIKNKDILNERI